MSDSRLTLFDDGEQIPMKVQDAAGSQHALMLLAILHMEQTSYGIFESLQEEETDDDAELLFRLLLQPDGTYQCDTITNDVERELVACEIERLLDE